MEQSKVIRALLVDDDAFMRKIQSAILAKAGFEVHLAEGGAQAIAMLQRATYDVVFMDMQMPEMDGLQTTTALRKAGQRLPIIAVTGDNDEETKRQCFAAGMNGFLSKPISLKTLHDIVKQVLA